MQHVKEQPAARAGDNYAFEHARDFGIVRTAGVSNVLIESKEAATLGDASSFKNLQQNGAADTVISGLSGVLNYGMTAARKGDHCIQGGKVFSGGSSGFITGSKPGGYLQRCPVTWCHTSSKEKSGKSYRKPSPAERKEVTNQTIEVARTLLKNKLQMLRKKDPPTLNAFASWFGNCDAKTKHIILERIRNLMILLRKFTHRHCYEITNLHHRRKAYSLVYPDDIEHRVALGHYFWQAPSTGDHSKAGKLIQALSHFYGAGSLKDYAFGDKSCLALVSSARDKALYNAENFARFIES